MTTLKIRQTLSEPLLKTKIVIPPVRSRVIERLQLLERVQQRSRDRLLLVSAPAGYGKTTLVSAWAQRAPIAVAWYTIDQSDNDPTRFFTYLIAALQVRQEELGATSLALLASPQGPPLESILTPLINELTCAPESVLVLDDYHLITETAIHTALTFLLDHLPSNLHLIIVSCTEPPLPLARLRARQQLQELRANDLRFSPTESAAFLTQVMSLQLTSEALTTLEQRTEGWVTGLQLAALSLQKRPAGGRDVMSIGGSDRFLFDYLADEVLQRQEEQVQTFLLETSVLTRLSGGLCEAVTTQQRGQKQLEELERANLFVTALDEERESYCYHPLFAEFLRKRLSQKDPGRSAEVQQRAASWCEQQGRLNEAIEYALAAGEYQRAANLIERVARALLTNREFETLLQWLEVLPTALLRERPRLCVVYGWARLFSFQAERIEALLEMAEQGLEGAVPTPEEQQQLRGEIAAMRATLSSLRSDLDQTLELSSQALAWLAVDDVFTRGTISFFQGVAYFAKGQVVPAQQAYLEALRTSLKAQNLFLALLAQCYLARLLSAQGALALAMRVYQEAIELAEGQSQHQFLATGMNWLGLGELYYEQNDLEAAREAVGKGLELGRQGAAADVLVAGYTMMARLEQARGQSEEARSYLAQVKQITRPPAVLWVAAETQAYQVQWWLTQQDIVAAALWAKGQEHLADSAEPGVQHSSTLSEIPRLALVRVMIAQEQWRQAEQLLERLRQVAEAEQRLGSVIKIAVLQARVWSEQGKVAEALVALQRALELAEPARYRRVFIDEGEPLKQLLRQTAARGIKPGYSASLLADFPVDGEQSGPAEQPLLDPLSERELEVLGLVIQGRTNQEIAEQLMVSLNTAKTHLSHILTKLHVGSRTQAVARARELRLFKEAP